MTDASRDFLALMGFVYLEHRQAEKAVTVFEALTTLDPDDPAPSRSLAYAYLIGRRPGDCLRQADDHLAKFPADPQADAVRLTRSRALWKLGRQNEARRAFKQPAGK